ncbi:MAG TPA: DUF3365 domain-containing protein [Bryobacteraceae bacterium]|nr:DUF3365 domain-containing protein [Bryobacteraceae bacterium]
MNRLLPGTLICVAALLAAPPEPAAQARAAVAGLAAKLKALLGDELAKGGFEGAVHACSTSAQKVTREFAAQSGVDIRRVTLKYCNPANAPDAWERAQLEQWESVLKSGKPLPEEVFVPVDVNGVKTHRLMKPIVIQGMCLSRHGSATQIPDPVKKQIAKSYPKDLATGYKPGELRGAFSVKIPVRTSPAR